MLQLPHHAPKATSTPQNNKAQTSPNFTTLPFPLLFTPLPQHSSTHYPSHNSMPPGQTIPMELSYTIAKKVCSQQDLERLACAYLASTQPVNASAIPSVFENKVPADSNNSSMPTKPLENSAEAKLIVSSGRSGSSRSASKTTKVVPMMLLMSTTTRLRRSRTAARSARQMDLRLLRRRVLLRRAGRRGMRKLKVRFPS